MQIIIYILGAISGYLLWGKVTWLSIVVIILALSYSVYSSEQQEFNTNGSYDKTTATRLGLTFALVVIIFIYALFININENNIYKNQIPIIYSTPIDSVTGSANINISDIETRINKSLPTNVLLREYEKIPNTKDLYLGIYVSDFILDELTVKTEAHLNYSNCVDSTKGQAVTGIYHLFLFKDNYIINDIIIPLLPYSDEGSNKISLSFNNTKYNNYNYFGGEKPNKDDELNMEKTKLIYFHDYNGDGFPYEFLLTGDTMPCGHTSYLVAGYDELNNKVILYKIKGENGDSYWYGNFKPNNYGDVEVIWGCGDHGSTTETISNFIFDKKESDYLLINHNEKTCL